LLSVAATAAIAFFLGVGAGSPATSDGQIDGGQLAGSSTDAAEAELEDIRTELEDADRVVNDLRSENRTLQRQLSSKDRQLRRSRVALAATRTKLNRMRSRAESAAAAAPESTGPSDDGGSECDSNYSGACVPIVSYDLNCDDISGSVTVVGSDPHGFDGDGDGSGCE
jgi:hypothetical protein